MKRFLAVTGYAVALLLWCWLVGIPNDPIGVALWLWLLAICWRLDWCWQFPKDWWPWLLALAVYGLARGVTDDIGFTTLALLVGLGFIVNGLAMAALGRGLQAGQTTTI